MCEVKGKKLLVLGGTNLSCEIIKEAKAMGAYVIVTDYHKDSPGKRLADKSFDISVADVNKVVELINKEHIDGVITGFADSILMYYLDICEAAGLPCYASREQIEISTNKAKFKKLCREHDVPVVKEYDIHSPLTIEDVKEIRFPVVVKPVDNSGSRGVFICRNENELIEGYNKALIFSTSGQVIVEDLMSGDEVTIFYILQDEQVQLIAMADKYTTIQYGGVPTQPSAYIYPSKYLTSYKNLLDEKVKKMFKSRCFKNGILFIQSFVKNGQCIFYEMGYRLTASLEYKIEDKIIGVNPLKLLINYALTGQMSKVDLGRIINPDFNSFGCNVTFSAKPGRIGAIKGVQDVLKIPGVLDVVNSHELGDEIPSSAEGTFSQIVSRVFAEADSIEHLVSVIDSITSTLKIYRDDGEEMIVELFNSSILLNNGEYI